MPKRSRGAPAAPQDAQGASRDDLERLRCAPGASQEPPRDDQRVPKDDPARRKGRRRASGRALKRPKSMGSRLWERKHRVCSRGSLGKRSRSDAMSIFGRFRESDDTRFVPRLSAKTKVQPSVLCIDVQRRKTSKIDLNSIENRLSRPLGGTRQSVLTVERRQSSDSGRLAATRGGSDDPGRSARRPRSLGLAAWAV